MAGKTSKADATTEAKAADAAIAEAKDNADTADVKVGDPQRDPALVQFPSKAGYPEVEIAQRSADVEERASEVHRKVFVVQKNPQGPDYDDDMHVRNIDAMRQGMINQGLRPTSDGAFVGAEEHEDGQSVILTYEVDAIPAAIATPPLGMVAVTVEADQALKRDRAQALAARDKA